MVDGRCKHDGALAQGESRVPVVLGRMILRIRSDVAILRVPYVEEIVKRVDVLVQWCDGICWRSDFAF